MANYFNKYPKFLYNSDIVTNILTRVKLLDPNNHSLFYDYVMKEGDTAEIIADKIYGNPERHWIILISNNIIDGQLEIPLTEFQFNNYIENKYKSLGANTIYKYTGLEYARNTNLKDPFAIRKTTTIIDNNTNEVSITTKFISETDPACINSTHNVKHGTIDLTYVEEISAYINLYDYEYELNENKRKIKFLRPDLVPEFEKQFNKLMKG